MEEHTHTEECYDEDNNLICEKPEHTHDETCLIEPFAVTLTSDGLLLPSGAELAPVTVLAEISGGTAPYALELQVRLEDAIVHEESVEAEAAGEQSFSFMPESLGVYAVSAAVTDAEGLETTAELSLAVARMDEETPAEWEATFAHVALTGDPRTDVVAIARTQLGYAESETNFIVGADGKRQGYTRYGAWYGSPYEEWCAMFASFCLHYAKVDVPLGGNCDRWIEDLSAQGLYHRASAYCPMPGDLVFFDWDGDGSADHVGLAQSVTPSYDDISIALETIEGNAGKQVKQRSYTLPDNRILGYGQVGANPEQARIDNVIALIDALPDIDVVEARLAALEDDEVLYEACFKEILMQVQTAYVYYEDLGPAMQLYVTNADRLLGDYGWMFMSTMDLSAQDALTVYQVNQYSQKVTTLVYGGSVGVKLSGSGMSFHYWDVIVVEKNDNGIFYVAQYVTTDGDKRDYKASTADGFVLLLYDTAVNTAVGNVVAVDFDYKQDKSYDANGYGVVTFAGEKADKANSVPTVKSAPTRDLIEVNLYDYGTNINDLYSPGNGYPGFQQDKGTLTVSNTASSNFGNNITADLAAGKSGVTNAGGAINATNADASVNRPISGAMKSTLGDDGYPELSNGISLKYLFSSSQYAEKKNTQNIDGLFRKDEKTGSYHFNSRENHAQFNAGSNTFTLYNALLTPNFTMYPFGNFLPFNDIIQDAKRVTEIDRNYLLSIVATAQAKGEQGGAMAAAYKTLASNLYTWISKMDAEYPTGWNAANAINEYFNANVADKKFNFTLNSEPLPKLYSLDYDVPTDFFFGMEMKMTFMQPKGGLTGKDGKQPMVFYFTGDDDVWVYIDDVLFLDLSGIHRHVGGEIDFVKGEVRYYELSPATGDVSKTAYETKTFREIIANSDLGQTEKTAMLNQLNGQVNGNETFADYTSHRFNFYYMERGAGSGVCRMNFNFPLLKKNSISVSKELSADASFQGNPDFRFQILKENRTELFIGPYTEYTIYNGDPVNGQEAGTGTTDANGVFTIKAGQTAVFEGISENAGSYFVRELLDRSLGNQYDQIYVDGTTQTKSDSGITVGSDTFTGVDSPVKNISDGATFFHFNNHVDADKLGSLSVTKQLTLLDGGTSTEEFTFQITLDGVPLPVGTTYTVGSIKKTVADEGMISLKAGETAIISNILAGTHYKVEEIGADGYNVSYDPGQSRTIPLKATATVTATNREIGTSLKIPVTKSLTGSDGGAHSYQFKLIQVDANGTAIANGTQQTLSINIPANGTRASGNFTLYYRPDDLGGANSKVFHYKITEEIVATETNTLFDSSEHNVEVTVTKAENGLSAAITNGSQNVQFTNRLTSKLTLTKQIVGTPAPDKTFSFTIDLTCDGFSGMLTGTIASGQTTTPQTVTFTNGRATATIVLKDGEQFAIDLPIGTTWRITEAEADGYWVKNQVDSGEVTVGNDATGTLTKDGSNVTFLNYTAYVLPETGGRGTKLYTAGGLALMLYGALLLYKKRRCGGRRDAVR